MFQDVFGLANISGKAAQPVSLAAQPVGFAAGRQGARERIQQVRNGYKGEGHEVVVASEGFLLETDEDAWMEVNCLVLRDFKHDLDLVVYSQGANVDPHFIKVLQEGTPADYPRRWSGYSKTVGEVVGQGWGVEPASWQEGTCGVSRKDIIKAAATNLAGLYKRRLAQLA